MECAVTAALDPVRRKANRDHLEAMLDRAEWELRGRPYLAGEEYSAADVMMTPLLLRIQTSASAGCSTCMYLTIGSF